MAYKRELIAKTKNLFNYSGKLRQYYDIANGTIIETLPNGAILQGDVGTDAGDGSYSNGWFRPGYPDGYGTEVTLSANDTVTISADYEILERNFISPTNVGIHLYGTEELSFLNDSQVETGVLYRVKQTYTITKDGQYYPVFTLNSSKVKITNIQIEKNSTATEYVPYGYLSSYKKLLKVSDVCQLLDKRKYPVTATVNGVTYTNNGDGTISVKGTRGATGDSFYRITWTQNIIKEHVYCLIGVIKDSGVEQYCLSVTGAKTLNDKGSGDIETNLIDRRDLIISLPANTTVNTIVKPQLFDLTEMFGAGNEPKTVAEFKAKFPNELYDYSPRCWVKSYKTGLIAKTKNLFNISKVNTTTTLNVVDNTISAKNTSSDPLPWTYNNSQYKTTLDAGRYFLSFDNMSMASSVNESTQLLVRDDTNTWVARITDEAFVNNKVVTSFTLDKQTNIGIQLKLYTQVISNFQIEKGSEATNYVPYGYL